MMTRRRWLGIVGVVGGGVGLVVGIGWTEEAKVTAAAEGGRTRSELQVAAAAEGGRTRSELQVAAAAEGGRTRSELQVAPAQEVAASSPAVPASPPAAPARPAPSVETVMLEDDLPPGAQAEGTWVWVTEPVASGTKAHGHPSAKGMQSHRVTFATPWSVPKDGEIVTSVWLDPADSPRGIMLKFTLAGGGETGVYWEGEEEVFNPGETEEIWYYGLLPEFGTWTPLTVAAEDLGLEESKITGITFVTYDGRAVWDRTVIRRVKLPLVTDDAGMEDLDLPDTGALPQ